MFSHQTERVRPLFLVSLAIAVLCLVPLLFHGYTKTFDLALDMSLCLSLLWIVVVCIAVKRYRQHGLWLLIGAPMALYYPFVFLLWMGACLMDKAACP